jgi:hypothetical protein
MNQQRPILINVCEVAESSGILCVPHLSYLTILLGSQPTLAARMTLGSACSMRTRSSRAAKPATGMPSTFRTYRLELLHKCHQNCSLQNVTNTHFPPSKQILCIFWCIHHYEHSMFYCRMQPPWIAAFVQSLHFSLCFLIVEEHKIISKHDANNCV